MSEDRSLTRRRLLSGLAILALPALAACGKRSRVKLPPEKAGQATYPRAYPPPSSVNPGAVRSAPQPGAQPGLEEEPTPEKPLGAEEDLGYEDTTNDPYYKAFPEFEDEEYR